MSPEKRKYPRLTVCTQQRIVQLTSANRAEKSIVLSKDISASGFSFRTSTLHPVGSLFLAHLDNQSITDLQMNRAGVMKYGKYLLARIIWSKLVTILENPLYEVGCAFVGLTEGDTNKLDLFTRLVNLDTVEQLNTSTSEPTN